MRKIERALISVYDKTDLLALATALVQQGVEILSTGGTARHLRDAGITIRDVSAYTGAPEMFDGRVKTLHPKIHGGLLADRDDAKHSAQATAHGIAPIDMVVCNLYPFEATVARPDATLADAIENIDIGGPTMIRAAAKNYRHVAVLTAPRQYGEIIADLSAQAGALSDVRRFELAKAAFAHTAHYDDAIAAYLSAPRPEITDTAEAGDTEDPFTDTLTRRYEKVRTLRYGENPHQRAAFYKTETAPTEVSAAWATQVSGQPLSFNNLLDLEAALEIVKDFDAPACAIIKHNNPCGLATADTLMAAFMDALECDRTSAFGSIVGLNREVTLQTANTIREAAKSGVKIDAIIAPSYTEKARRALARVKRRPILEAGPLAEAAPDFTIRNITGGLLVQDPDRHVLTAEMCTVATARTPTAAETRALLFAWKACKHVKSNCILLADGTRTVGIGAGQMSRVDAAIIAIRKAGDRVNGAVLASDAFFPFPDGVEIAGEAGIRAIIQPGGSVNDAPVIDAANAYGITMLLTGVRHFKH